jgi:transposase
VTSRKRKQQTGQARTDEIRNGSKEKKRISDLENRMPPRKFASLNAIKAYIEERAKVEDVLRKFYNRPFWRRRRWWQKQRRQQWRDDLVSALKKKFEHPGKQLVLAWGMGTAYAWKINIKGSPPGPQKALRDYVGKFIPVIATNEYKTTVICSRCGEDTTSIIGKRREGDESTRKKKVHGLRCCDNSENGERHLLSRDYNAAINIRQRCLARVGQSQRPNAK